MFLALQRILLYFPPRGSLRALARFYIHLSIPAPSSIYTSFEFDQYTVLFLRMRIDGKQKKHCQTPNSKYDPSRNFTLVRLPLIDPFNRPPLIPCSRRTVSSFFIIYLFFLSSLFVLFLFSLFRFPPYKFITTSIHRKSLIITDVHGERPYSIVYYA